MQKWYDPGRKRAAHPHIPGKTARRTVKCPAKTQDAAGGWRAAPADRTLPRRRAASAPRPTPQQAEHCAAAVQRRLPAQHRKVRTPGADLQRRADQHRRQRNHCPSTAPTSRKNTTHPQTDSEDVTAEVMAVEMLTCCTVGRTLASARGAVTRIAPAAISQIRCVPARAPTHPERQTAPAARFAPICAAYSTTLAAHCPAAARPHSQ